MSLEFKTYAAIVGTAWLITLIMMGPRNVLDLSRCAGWYLLAFLATYVVRPGFSEVIGDYQMFDVLKLGRFEEHWQLMTFAVCLAILSFGIGYAAGGPPNATKTSVPAEPAVERSKVRKLIFFLIFFGYFAAIVSLKTDTFSGERGDYEGTAVGVYEHNTAWFAQDDLFISTGGILYYMATGNLAMSLMLTGPWIFFRIIFGWGRSVLLGHFFGLMAVYFLRARFKKKVESKKSSQAMLIGAAVVVVLVLFPLMGMLRDLKSQFHMGSAAISKDALSMVKSGADPQDMLQTYLGTNSSVTGFETTLDYLVNDKRAELGTQYLYYYVFQPIPRIVWTGKGTPFTWPEDLLGISTDPLLALIGAAPGSIGMAYQQWGWLGIPIELFLTGLIIRKGEEMARRRPSALHVQLAYVGLYAMVPQLGRDSLFYMIPNAWLFRFGIPVIILWLMYRGALERSRWRRTAISRVPGPAIASGQT